MGDLGEVAQDRQRVRALGILRLQFGQRLGRRAPQDHVEKVEHPASVRQPQHSADLGCGGFPRAVADRLIQQRGRVAGRAFRRPRDQRQRVVGDLCALGRRDLAQQGDHHLGLDPPQVEALASRQDRDGNLPDFSRREDELHVRRRLFQRLQQRVEGRGAEHVHLVDDVDLVARRGRPIVNGFNDLADVVHAGSGRGVHLEHVHVAAFGDGHAMFADAAGVGRGTAGAVRADAVHALGDDPRRGRLPGAPDARHDEGLRDAVRRKGVLQRADHGVLADQIGKGFRPVFPGKHLVGGGVGHSVLV